MTYDIIVIHSFVGDVKIYHKELLGCHLDKVSGKHAEGPDPDTVDIDLNPLRIVEVINGVRTVLL